MQALEHRKHENVRTSLLGQTQSLSRPMSRLQLWPKVGAQGKVWRLQRAFNDTLPEYSPSLQPCGGTSQGRESVWLFNNPCWSPLELTWTSCIHDMPWQRVAQRNNALCCFIWNHLSSEPSICQHCLMPLLYWKRQQAIHPYASPPQHSWFLWPLCLLRPLFLHAEDSCPHSPSTYKALPFYNTGV